MTMCPCATIRYEYAGIVVSYGAMSCAAGRLVGWRGAAGVCWQEERGGIWKRSIIRAPPYHHARAPAVGVPYLLCERILGEFLGYCEFFARDYDSHEAGTVGHHPPGGRMSLHARLCLPQRPCPRKGAYLTGPSKGVHEQPHGVSPL